MAAKQKKSVAAANTASAATAAMMADVEQDSRRTLELVFYVHMEMAHLADRVLSQYDMGRAHHRVLYLTAHNPGITVNEILSILRITNQALSRTLNQLMRMDLIEQRPGKTDRRHRCHYCTPKGLQLDRRLTKLQFEHIETSLRHLPRKQLETFWAVLYEMVRDQDKPWISVYQPE
ncbi:MarR family winged helix-turn-helix transcriptional regulator [Ferrovibrio sp.]|uniref:MarR family winged helix-turn-helix transcriptional regulator n=1 Tax=Ferrovibrio sp. TaxID=1917215 RepID=UPI003D276725